MDEAILRNFFVGKARATEVVNDLSDEIKQLGQSNQTFYIRDLAQDFRIDRKMLLKLLDAVLAGELPSAALEPIGFALITSDRFEWEEDDLIADVLSDWSAPQIHYPLTLENLERFKRWLLEIEPYPTAKTPTTISSRPEKLIFQRERKKLF